MNPGQNYIVQKSIGGALLEVSVLAISPSGKLVKLSDLGWQKLDDIHVVEHLGPAESVSSRT